MISNIVMSKSQILLFAAHLCAHNKQILSTQNSLNNSLKFNQLLLHKREEMVEVCETKESQYHRIIELFG